jgi:HEAT repeat protein
MDASSSRKTRGRRRCALLLAVFAACAGCSTYIGTTPKSFLHHVRSNPDPNIRYIAYAKLGRPDLYDNPEDKSQAVETLVAKLDEGREPVAIRAVIIRTLGELGDRRARHAIARLANDPNTEPVLKVEAYRALGKVGTAEDATMLARVMNTDHLEDCRIAAIEGIGALKAEDPRIYHVLIEGMEHEDPAIRLQSYRALKQITGKDLGNQPEAWRREFEPRVAQAEKQKPAVATPADPSRPPATGSGDPAQPSSSSRRR